MDGLNRELTKTRIIQALREELASVERRAEEERIAHNATKMASVEREVELEHQAVEASNALARNQIFVEIEGARLMKRLAKIKEEQGQIDEATDLMQEVAVKNYLPSQRFNPCPVF